MSGFFFVAVFLWGFLVVLVVIFWSTPKTPSLVSICALSGVHCSMHLIVSKPSLFVSHHDLVEQKKVLASGRTEDKRV